MYKMDDRLLSLAGLVGRTGVCADVGTDHGYLAIHLIKNGHADRVIASDINSMPLGVSERNIAACGLSHSIDTVLCPGLEKVCVFEPDTIVIAGMGGELIAEIIATAPDDYCKTHSPTLVLQPMTGYYELALYLSENGFEILDEVMTYCNRKIYRAMKARYCGRKAIFLFLELMVGRHNLMRGGDIFLKFMAEFKKKYEKIIKGKEISGLDTELEKEVLRQVREFEESNECR